MFWLMKPSLLLVPILFFLIGFSSCRNKTVLLLTKKWDCVQVENIVPPDTKLLSAKDSSDAEQLKAMVLSLNWTFKKNMKYECAINDRITTQGSYALMQEDKLLVCTADSENGIKRYIIRSISENELVLSGNAANTSLVLHFRPH